MIVSKEVSPTILSEEFVGAFINQNGKKRTFMGILAKQTKRSIKELQNLFGFNSAKEINSEFKNVQKSSDFKKAFVEFLQGKGIANKEGGLNLPLNSIEIKEGDEYFDDNLFKQADTVIIHKGVKLDNPIANKIIFADKYADKSLVVKAKDVEANNGLTFDRIIFQNNLRGDDFKGNLVDSNNSLSYISLGGENNIGRLHTKGDLKVENLTSKRVYAKGAGDALGGKVVLWGNNHIKKFFAYKVLPQKGSNLVSDEIKAVSVDTQGDLTANKVKVTGDMRSFGNLHVKKLYSGHAVPINLLGDRNEVDYIKSYVSVNANNLISKKVELERDTLYAKGNSVIGEVIAPNFKPSKKTVVTGKVTIIEPKPFRYED